MLQEYASTHAAHAGMWSFSRDEPDILAANVPGLSFAPLSPTRQLPFWYMVYTPQPLRVRREAFVSSDYVFELKMDGFRALAVVDGGQCILYSRNGAKFSGFRQLAGDIAASIPLTRRVVLDGEIVCLDENGYPQFSDLLFHRSEPCFFAFDMLSLEGHDLRHNALIERKAELRRLLSTVSLASRMRYADHVDENGIGLFELVCDRDLEGIVAKLKHGPYVHRREESTWFKIRNMNYSQKAGREELFERDRRSEPTAGCTHVQWRVQP